MKYKILLHLPHTSLKVPKAFYKGLCLSKEEFRKYNLQMTDLGVDEFIKDWKGKRIKSKYSRLYCDVEKFKDDHVEIMSKYGQGVIYTHTYDGKELHSHNEKYRKKVFKYYDSYHRKLDRITKRILKKCDILLLLDIHSFSEKQVMNPKDSIFPDICIGLEEEYMNEEILKKLIYAIQSKGYSYQINYPYTGSMIPNYIMKNGSKKLVSIMIEMNKRIYL